MQYEVRSRLRRIEAAERRALAKKPPKSDIKARLREKVPQGVRKSLTAAFEKAFGLLFLNCGGVISMSFDREKLVREFCGQDALAEKTRSLNGMERLRRSLALGQLKNGAATAAAGAGLGFLGLGLPDIPLLTATMLKGLYELASGYGYDFDSQEEQLYILRLIRAALAAGDERAALSRLLDLPPERTEDMGAEIAAASEALADALLAEKFIQGIPLIGAVGGIVNGRLYGRISRLAAMKYEKRYLMSRLR
ncbi:MAG: EcsC family protein [Candidatus Heteroscillospira sp.]